MRVIADLVVNHTSDE
ncbi:hypothetical protein ABZ260_46235, partial [Streptosporangium sp. NPDC006013]